MVGRLDSFEHLFDDGAMSSARPVAALEEQRATVERLRAKVAAMEHKAAGDREPALRWLKDLGPMHPGSS